MKKFWFIFHFLFLTPLFGYCQNVKNISSLDNQIQQDSKNLIIIGETHTSASGPIIVGEFLKHLDESGQSPQLLLELGASAVYLLNKYLKTGNEELIEGIVLGGVFNEWKNFWQKKYLTNKNLSNKEQLKIIGIDVERVGD